MIKASLEEVARESGGRLEGGRGGVEIESVSISTLHPADLFVAVNGEKTDGALFIGEAFKKGFKAALTHAFDPSCPLPQIVVKDSVEALSSLAKANLEKRREKPGFTEIALTGSVGKTTTKDILFQLFSPFAPTVANTGSFNNELGLPLTCLKVKSGTSFLIAEMGANKIGDIARLFSIAPCDVALELRVGFAHEGEFGSRQNIFRAKSELVQKLKPWDTAVLNAQDRRVREMAALTKAKVRYFSLEFEPGTEACAKNLELDELGRPNFDLFLEGKDAGPVSLPLLGEHSASNALAAAACAKICGMPDDQVRLGLSSLSGVSPHRLNLFESESFGKKCLVLDDTFNANPDSMLNCIKVAQRIAAAGSRKTVFVLSPMLELGKKGEEYHREVGRAVRECCGSLVVVCQDESEDRLAKAYMEEVPGARLVRSLPEAKEEAGKKAREAKEALVVLKGSHAFHLDSLSQDLEKGI
ncbi:MAG: UDP-N-acetylmuramoyl-tripeptide--D-alanyl-D-alanine ligase [Aeriscardovia sp.]|nr:UDP-N-acetylmuramoyl-tripeptide--D-alanyl-D-alanine ligase [Aeriscardovia sp.]